MVLEWMGCSPCKSAVMQLWQGIWSKALRANPPKKTIYTYTQMCITKPSESCEHRFFESILHHTESLFDRQHRLRCRSLQDCKPHGESEKTWPVYKAPVLERRFMIPLSRWWDMKLCSDMVFRSHEIDTSRTCSYSSLVVKVVGGNLLLAGSLPVNPLSIR